MKTGEMVGNISWAPAIRLHGLPSKHADYIFEELSVYI